MTLGETLKRARIARGWKQRDLAERTNISVAMISRVETGERRLSWELLDRVATELGLRVEVRLVAR